MSKEKQIEEVASLFVQFCADELGADISLEIGEDFAEKLIAKEWRKESEGEWETIPRYKSNTLNTYSHICKVEGCGYFYMDFIPCGYKFCPNCGAKMKGE